MKLVLKVTLVFQVNEEKLGILDKKVKKVCKVILDLRD